MTIRDLLLKELNKGVVLGRKLRLSLMIRNRWSLLLILAFTSSLLGCATVGSIKARKTPRVIWSIEIEGRDENGNKAKLKLSESQLLQAIENVPTARFVRWTRLKLFGSFSVEKSRRVFKSDLERIKQLYRFHGFYNAKPRFVIEPDLTTLAYENAYRNYQRVKIKLIVFEGKQVQVQKFQLEIQPKNHPQLAQLKKLITPKLALGVGKGFSTSDYRLAKAQILKRLQDNSYALAKIRGRVLIDKFPQKPTAEVQITVRLGPKCSFGEITIVGNKRVEARLLQFLFTFKKGQSYKVQAMVDSQRVLSGLGLFTTVDFKPQLKQIAKARSGPCYVPAKGQQVPVSNKPCPVPIRLELAEDQFQTIKIGFGFVIDGQRNQLETGINWTWLHVFGGLRKLELDARPGLAFLPDIIRQYDVGPDVTVSLTFKQPIFLPTQAELGLRVLYRYAAQVGDSDYQTISPSTWFSLPLARGLNVRFSWNFEVALGVQNPLTIERENYLLDFFEQQLVLDLRDDPLRTTRGLFFSLSLQEAGLFGKFAYFKVSPELRLFLPLPGRMVLAGRVQYGIMFSTRKLSDAEKRADQEKDALLSDKERAIFQVVRRSPLTQRFFAGGANSVRGWTSRYLGPLACQNRSQQRINQSQQEQTNVAGKNESVVRVFGARDSTTRTLPGAGQSSAGAYCGAEAGEVARSRFGNIAGLRSWLPQGGRPGSDYLPSDTALQVVPMGGEHLLLGSIELRIPLDFLLSNLGVVLFADAGVVQLVPRILDDKGNLASDFIPSLSLGGGIRYHLFLGAIRVDLAYRIVPDHLRFPLQRSWELHFSIGESF